MRKILKFLKPYKWGVVLVFILVAVRAVLDLLLPKLMSNLLTEGLGLVENATGLSFNSEKVWFWASIMMAVTVVSIIVTIISGYFESKIASGFGKSLRSAVYKKVQSFSLSEVDQFTTSSLITRTSNDIQQLQGYVNMLLRMIILQPILAIGAITLSILEHPRLSMILVVSVLSLLGMIVVIFIVTLPKIKIIQKLVDKLNLVTRENLTGLRVVRAYNTEAYQADKVNQQSLENKRLNVFINRVMNVMWPAMGLIMGLTSIAIIYFASTSGFIDYLSPDKSGFNPTQMSALMQYGMRTIMSFMFLTMIFIMIPRATVSARRIIEVLESESSVVETKHPIEITDNMDTTIEFDQVEFRYPDADQAVLKNISFTAIANQTTAFIGSTGSGKSTLINLIPRFYEISSGDIRIGGTSIKAFRLHDLYELIGYVPQKGVLFKGTIRYNIEFGKKLDDAAVFKAAKIAQASNFIESFEDGYQTLIAQGGTNVSGGQRQRLSIARALAKKPKILIFDDSFSALDYKTDQTLRKAMKEEVIATTLIVAQRINTIKDADQIIVLDQGSIVGIGTHKELLKHCPVYIEIAHSQLSKEELEHAV